MMGTVERRCIFVAIVAVQRNKDKSTKMVYHLCEPVDAFVSTRSIQHIL
jgi:hypothetical protein